MGMNAVTSTSTSFKVHNQWIVVLIITSHLQSSTEVEDCPLLSRTGQYCIKNKDGIVLTILDNDIWIMFNQSVTKLSFSFSEFKSGILPIPEIHVGEPNRPILAVYSQLSKWRVGVENKNMLNNDNNSKNTVNDAFVLIQSTLCMDCCFIMAVNFTQFSSSDNINETGNGTLYSFNNNLFISSEENKPTNLVSMVWQMGTEPGGDCLDSSPVQGPGTRQGSNYGPCGYCSHAPTNYRTLLSSEADYTFSDHGASKSWKEMLG